MLGPSDVPLIFGNSEVRKQSELNRTSWLRVFKPNQELYLDSKSTVDSKKLEHGCRMIYAGVTSFFGLGLEDGCVPTFWLFLYVICTCLLGSFYLEGFHQEPYLDSKLCNVLVFWAHFL